MERKHKLSIIIVVSLIFHLLAVIAGSLAVKWGWFDFNIKKAREEETITFELAASEPDREFPGQVVESPDDAAVDEPVEDPEYLSDQHTKARNAEDISDDLALDSPFIRGDIEYPELPGMPGEQGNPGSNGEISQEQHEETENTSPEQFDFLEEDPEFFVDQSAPSFRDVLAKSGRQGRPGLNNRPPTPSYNNTQSRVEDFGGIALSTYNWEFAPYILMLKSEFRSNNFPPPAFSRMGLINGIIKLRFKISRDGELTELEVVEYRGHKTLMETARKAVEVSAPFAKLPKHFPDEFLELQWTFIYSNGKEVR